MNLRNTLIAAALALVVAFLILRFVASVHNKHDCDGLQPCVGAGAGWPQGLPGSTEVGRPSVVTGVSGDQSGNFIEENKSTLESGWEQSIVRDGSIDLVVILEITDDATFDDLVAELQRQQSPIGSERRTQFETLVYAHPSSLDGSVSLDVIECGSLICVADLRSGDVAKLERLIRDVTESDSFAGRVITELPGSQIYSDGESRRLVFPHDPDVTGFSVPEDSIRESVVEIDEN